MKRTLALLAAGVLVGLLMLARPALSLEPYVAAPVDFELDAPAAAPESAARAAGAGGAGFVSEPLQTPKRFNLVGVRWSGDTEAAIAIRARDTDGRWQSWTPLVTHPDGGPDPASAEGGRTSVSQPIWVGEAYSVQYRVSKPVRGLKLHFVNSMGTTTPGKRLQTALRRGIHSALVALARPLSASAAGRQPRIVPRAAWGAANCRPRGRPENGQVKAAFVHHTVSTNNYSRAQAPAAVLAICRYHRNSNRWDDIGYNFVVDKYGTIYEGRAGGVDRPVVGAQAQGYNDQSTGIANLGTFSSVPQSRAAIRAMTRLIRWKLPLHGVQTGGRTQLVSRGGTTNRYSKGMRVTFSRVSGHRDADRTACPGTRLFGQVPRLRRSVGNVQPAPGTPRPEAPSRQSPDNSGGIDPVR